MKSMILAGGKGTRLWPLSRELMPKQFIKLFNGNSLFQETVKRALLISDVDEIYIVTNKDYKYRVLDDLDELDISIPHENILLEPLAKNTLPATLWAVTEMSKEETCVTSVLPSDHLLNEKEAFLEAFNKAEKLAKDGYLVTFGIKPNKPHTGYGYIKPGSKIGDGYIVEEFKENLT